MEDLDHLKVAIVTDWMHSPGGADRFIQSILKLFPNATLYTSLYFPKRYKDSWNQPAVEVKESFLSKLPFHKKLYRHFSVLTPYAFENLDLEGYDLVISVSAGSAKGVITDVDQPHVGIILTPTRFVWDNESNMRNLTFAPLYRLISPWVRRWLRVWESSAVKRIDHVLTISKYIQGKAKETYELDSEVLYPGILSWWFEPSPKESPFDFELLEEYFLVISRLYDYKRVDWAVKAAIETGENLIVAGEGQDRKHLKKLAKGHDNIQIIGRTSDEQSKFLMSNARAFLFCGIEDYGLIPVEAMACGCPVLAYNLGGVTETVVAGKSGDFFEDYEGLVSLVNTFDDKRYKKENIVARARMFTQDRTISELSAYIKEIMNGYGR